MLTLIAFGLSMAKDRLTDKLAVILHADVAGSSAAIGKKDIRAIIEEAFPGAIITEIEKEKYRGKKVYEGDFKHDGKKLEAIISLEGEIFKIGIDDKDLFCAQKNNSARGPRLNPVCLKTL